MFTCDWEALSKAVWLRGIHFETRSKPQALRSSDFEAFVAPRTAISKPQAIRSSNFEVSHFEATGAPKQRFRGAEASFLESSAFEVAPRPICSILAAPRKGMSRAKRLILG